MIRPDYLIGTKNEVFGPGGIQNAVVETLVRTEGPIDAKLVDKSISDNGTYSASAEGADGFKKVVVDVPNTYFLSDEGKVVSGGSLVTQTSSAITENGVVDTTLIDSVDVNVVSENDSKYGYVSGSDFSLLFAEVVTIPDGYTAINGSTFDSKSTLKEVIIPSSMSTINSNAFVGSVNLEKITINKAEGSISGAPWGAPNAQVIWTG